MSEKEPILTAERLTVFRDTYAAIQEVSFSVETGTDTAIVGPNGAGKSTLVQALLGVLPHQAGRVSVLGHSLAPSGRLAPSIRQQIAYLPQSFLVDRRIPMTVQDVVGLGWDAPGLRFPWVGHRARQHAVRQALSGVEAWDMRHKMISSLSGGETKRVLLAYCLVRPRRLLVLDEAPAGLDMRGEGEFYQLLGQLKREHGWTILQISHDLDMVRRNCDRVICLNHTIQCQGTPDIALADKNLLLTYGSGFSRYRHSCQRSV